NQPQFPTGPIPGQTSGQSGMPRFPQPQPTPAQGGNTGRSYIGSQPYLGSTGSGQMPPGQTYPGQTYPGQNYPGQPNSGQANSGQPNPGQPFPGQAFPGQGYPQPATTPGTQGPNAAADMINRILTTPRPGGMPTSGIGGQTIGGGIAGVASQGEGEGVMVYSDRSVYKEWEFIF